MIYDKNDKITLKYFQQDLNKLKCFVMFEEKFGKF